MNQDISETWKNILKVLQTGDEIAALSMGDVDVREAAAERLEMLAKDCEKGQEHIELIARTFGISEPLISRRELAHEHKLEIRKFNEKLERAMFFIEGIMKEGRQKKGRETHGYSERAYIGLGNEFMQLFWPSA